MQIGQRNLKNSTKWAKKAKMLSNVGLIGRDYGMSAVLTMLLCLSRISLGDRK